MFLKKKEFVAKSNYFKNYTPPMSVCFISQINIIHEYTERESKYTGEIANTQVKLGHIACGNKCT